MIALFFLMFTNLLFCQTKNQTVKWMNTNGVSLSNIKKEYKIKDDFYTLSFTITKVDKDSLYYVLSKQRDDDGEIFGENNSISLKNILFEDISTLEKKINSDNIQGFNIKVKTFYQEKNKAGKYRKIEEVSDFFFPYLDEEKAKRVIKAIMNLAELSGASKNKQYY